MVRALLFVFLLGGILTSCTVLDHRIPTGDLIEVFRYDTIFNGVATSNNRIFLCFAQNDGLPGTRIGEVLSNGKVAPYPNQDWNNWVPGAPSGQKFVRTNSIRFGPDGLLWIVDTGTTQAGGLVVANGPKLIGIDITTNQVVKNIPLSAVVYSMSFVDDLRFNGPYIYVTDAGILGIIVLNTATGSARRVLENDTSTTQRRPLIGEGRILINPKGEQAKLHADQLEVSPDGSLFYFQPASGPMYNVPTSALNNESLTPTDLARQVKFFFDTPTTGGTAMDADGNIYLNDGNLKRMLKITPNGQSSVVIQDDRLIWGDATWIDDDGYAWIPASQQNRTPQFQAGKSTVEYPIKLYKLYLGVKPLRH